jgi:hypothetical protein
MTDFRALCEELLRSLENYPVQPLRDRDLCIRARAALAEQPVVPTDEELWEQYDEMDGDPEDWAWCRDYARAVLARWGSHD